VAPRGDGAFPVKCQESSFPVILKTIWLVTFIASVSNKSVEKKSDQRLRAFSSGFNQLTSVLISENASKD
jgi:hypothetical protein